MDGVDQVVNINGSASVELATMTVENGVRILLDDEVRTNLAVLFDVALSC